MHRTGGLFIIAVLAWGRAAHAQETTSPVPQEAGVTAEVEATGSATAAGATTGDATTGSTTAAPYSAPTAGDSGWQVSTTASATPASGGEEAGGGELTGAAYRMAHRFGLGAHTHMSGAFLAAYSAATRGMNMYAAHPWLNVSLLITLTPAWTLDIFAGFVLGGRIQSGGDNTGHVEGDGVTGFEIGVGPRILFTLASGEHSRLYTGVGAALLIGFLNRYRESTDPGSGCPDGSCGGYDLYGFALAAPLGFEYRFRAVPNLLFSAEVNFHFVFESVGLRYEDPGSTDIRSSSHYSNIIVGLGNPREPRSSGNILDYLTFLTIGFHYLI